MTSSRHPRVRIAAAGFASGLLLVASGCATHTDRLAPVMEQTSSGDYAAAVDLLNERLDVASSDQLPRKWGGDRALEVLDRSVLLQAMGLFDQAARDLSAAEEELEIIDFTKDPVATLAGYLYSDSAKAYRATPVERLSLNAVNLLNYVARGDLEGAAIEARRFQAVRDFLETSSLDDRGVFAFGAYLAGFVFEQSNQGDRALRYYEDALAPGPLASLVEPAAELSRHHLFRGPRLRALLEGQRRRSVPAAEADLLVVLNLGRVSHKIPERMPIGAAVGLAAAAITDDTDWLVYGATKVVVYPELVPTPSTLGSVSVAVDGNAVAMDHLIDLDDAVRREYEEMKPKIIAAALTRLAGRAAVAEGVRAAGKQESGLLGNVLAFLVEGTLVGLDRPDTRSWTMLPARVLVARVPVAPGEHEVTVRFDDGAPARTMSLSIPQRGYAAVVVTEPR
jgi:hypothetical protein